MMQNQVPYPMSGMMEHPGGPGRFPSPTPSSNRRGKGEGVKPPPGTLPAQRREVPREEAPTATERLADLSPTRAAQLLGETHSEIQHHQELLTETEQMQKLRDERLNHQQQEMMEKKKKIGAKVADAEGQMRACKDYIDRLQREHVYISGYLEHLQRQRSSERAEEDRSGNKLRDILSHLETRCTQLSERAAEGLRKGARRSGGSSSNASSTSQRAAPFGSPPVSPPRNMDQHMEDACVTGLLDSYDHQQRLSNLNKQIVEDVPRVFECRESRCWDAREERRGEESGREDPQSSRQRQSSHQEWSGGVWEEGHAGMRSRESTPPRRERDRERPARAPGHEHHPGSRSRSASPISRGSSPGRRAHTGERVVVEVDYGDSNPKWTRTHPQMPEGGGHPIQTQGEWESHTRHQSYPEEPLPLPDPNRRPRQVYNDQPQDGGDPFRRTPASTPPRSQTPANYPMPHSQPQPRSHPAPSDPHADAALLEVVSPLRAIPSGWPPEPPPEHPPAPPPPPHSSRQPHPQGDPRHYAAAAQGDLSGRGSPAPLPPQQFHPGPGAPPRSASASSLAAGTPRPHSALSGPPPQSAAHHTRGRETAVPWTEHSRDVYSFQPVSEAQRTTSQARYPRTHDPQRQGPFMPRSHSLSNPNTCIPVRRASTREQDAKDTFVPDPIQPPSQSYQVPSGRGGSMRAQTPLPVQAPQGLGQGGASGFQHPRQPGRPTEAAGWGA